MANDVIIVVYCHSMHVITVVRFLLQNDCLSNNRSPTVLVNMIGSPYMGLKLQNMQLCSALVF